jgi:RHS repeat-associated protein
MIDHTVDGKGATNAQYTYGSQYDGLYPTIIANAVGQSQQYSYDLNSGLVTSIIDANKNTTGYAYTSAGDLQTISYPDGGSVGVNYHGYAIPLNVTTTTVATPNPSKIKTVIYDGLGRPTQAQLNSDSAGADYVDTTYDGLNNVISISNPYRLGQSGVLALSQGTTSYVYDALGRKMMQCQPDNGTWPNPCTANNSYLKWSYAGNAVTFRDETGRQSQRTTDVLGRLTKVMEPNPSSGALTIETDYTYDALNNLWRVDQYGGPASKASTVDRIRTFTYDSLSRLLCASNPESSIAQCPTQATSTYTSGTVGYSYDANSNLISETDARGIMTGYGHDALNRVISKTSSGATNIAGFNYTFGYDSVSPPATNGVGRLLYITNNINAAEEYSYDSMGRITSQIDSLPSAPQSLLTTSAQYDLAGNLKQLTYPDGQVVNLTWNGAGEVSKIADSSGYQYLTSNSLYLPDGTPEGIYNGNGAASGNVLNNRSRVVIENLARVGADGPGTSMVNPNFLVHEYCYGPATASLASTIPGCPSLAVGADNGNILGIIDSLNGNNSQAFGYDNLNRLTSFANGNNTMSQTFGIDAWGNMTQAGTSTFNVNFGTNNRISCGSCYDQAGNLTSYNNGMMTNTYAYDAESKLVNVNNGAATYTYDADGSRVRKDTSGSWTEYVRFNGQPIAERSDDEFWSNYIYANGDRLARVDNYDIRVHVKGVNCSNCGTNPNTLAGTNSLSDANGYTIRPGDTLSWRQYEDNSARGGVYLLFTDGSNGNAATDTDGQPIDADLWTGWHVRMVDLSAFAGKTISELGLFDGASAPSGSWDIYYGDISLVSTDGTFIEIYHREQAGGTGALNVITNPSVSNLSAATLKVADFTPLTTTTFYHGDQIGSTRLLTAGTGWPVASDTYYPYGLESGGTSALSAPGNANHYKFTGKERDAESGLDYFGARYYGSSMGRFMSPDPSGLAFANPYNPQSLNLYSYVLNNPLINIDPTGKDCVYLNDAANGIEEIDADSDTSASDCGSTGGTHVNGSLTGYGSTDPDGTINEFYSNAYGTQNGSQNGMPNPSTWPGFWNYLGSFLNGSGPTNVLYGPGNTATQQMQNTQNVQAVKNQYAQAGCPGTPGSPAALQQGHLAAYMDSATNSPANPTQIEVGGYSGGVYTVNGTTTFTINNPSSMSSLDGESALNGSHSTDNPMGPTGAGHTVNQTFQWTEAGLCGH